jgi:hypothetical protein
MSRRTGQRRELLHLQQQQMRISATATLISTDAHQLRIIGLA